MSGLVVVPLGYGGWVSNPLFGTTSLLIRAGSLTFLLDAGEGVYASLKRCGFDVSDIDYVLVTHKHGDHVLGLPTLLVHAKRLNRKLKLIGPADLDLRALLSAVGIPDHVERVEAMLIEPPAEPTLVLSEGAAKVYAVAVEHTHPALAYRVEAGGASLVYTGDTRPTSSLVGLAKGCDLLIHEASYNPGEESVAVADGHSTARQAVETAARAGARYLMPVHFRLAPAILEGAGVGLLLPLPCTPVDVASLAGRARYASSPL
ncbi:MAG: MBL fold metallo-hydrolase [Thermofilum sp.]